MCFHNSMSKKAKEKASPFGEACFNSILSYSNHLCLAFYR